MAAAPPCGGLFPYPGPNAGSSYNPSAMPGTPLPDLILYGRADCGLCDETRELLRALLARARRRRPPDPDASRSATSTPTPHCSARSSPPSRSSSSATDASRLATSAAKLRRLLTDVLDGAPTTA